MFMTIHGYLEIINACKRYNVMTYDSMIAMKSSLYVTLIAILQVKKVLE